MIGLTIAQTVLSMFLVQAGATPAAYADRFVTVNGLRMHYLDWGNPGKPPMILIHGIARHAHTFDHIAAARAPLRSPTRWLPAARAARTPRRIPIWSRVSCRPISGRPCVASPRQRSTFSAGRAPSCRLTRSSS